MQEWSFGVWFLVVCTASLGSLISNFLGVWHLDHSLYKKKGSDLNHWKLQPKKMMSPKLVKEARQLTAINSILGGIGYGSYGYYLWLGGWSLLYFDFVHYGFIYSCVSGILVLIYMEVVFFYSHRFWHLHYFRFHKIHHHYSAPQPIAAIAIHPVEFLVNMGLQFLPTLIFPIHGVAYLIVLLHQGNINLQSHSGANTKRRWLPNNEFHDNHHRSVQCNFGQNTTLLDRWHGSLLEQGNGEKYHHAR